MPPQYLHESQPLTAAFGTLGFMAPEQESHGLVTVKTDIFGLGVTFCHLFTPTDDNHLMAVFRGHGIPAALQDLIGEMIAGSPAARPDDMKAVLGRLLGIRRDATISKG